MLKTIKNFFSQVSSNLLKPQFKKDGWMNILSGLGIQGRDKTVSTIFKNCKVFCANDDATRF